MIIKASTRVNIWNSWSRFLALRFLSPTTPPTEAERLIYGGLSPATLIYALVNQDGNMKTVVPESDQSQLEMAVQV